LILAAVALCLLAAVYMLRVRSITDKLQTGFRVRVAERERIARELHDTLLQGFQGLLLQFKGATNRMPGSELRTALEKALVRAQQTLIEGRNRVKELRAEGESTALADALAAFVSQVPAGEARPRVQVVQEGLSQTLHPLVRDELTRVAEEAVRNAILHGAPSLIEILILWRSKGLTLAIKDDGSGIPAEVLRRGGRTGHFGLTGMRERAERIGANLVVSSRAEGGTQVAVSVPANLAYVDAEGRRERPTWTWLRKLST
jgi:signal transduction histidine kinase